MSAGAEAGRAQWLATNLRYRSQGLDSGRRPLRIASRSSGRAMSSVWDEREPTVRGHRSSR